jgi:hypothetical protein
MGQIVGPIDAANCMIQQWNGGVGQVGCRSDGTPGAPGPEVGGRVEQNPASACEETPCP